MSQTGKQLLLVDDDQEIRELLQAYLSRSGFQVRTVADGAAFRQALCEQPADLVILDVMLPDEDGFSLCRWVREHERLASMPIIMLTASSDEADRVIGLELGADDYLGKPFSPRELLARIKALLRRVSFAEIGNGVDQEAVFRVDQRVPGHQLRRQIACIQPMSHLITQGINGFMLAESDLHRPLLGHFHPIAHIPAL